MTYEFFNDNTGICRFHRQWAESLTDEILMAHYDLDVDYKAHQFALAKTINDRESAKSVPWESERMADLMLGFLENWRDNDLQDPALDFWLERFHSDKKAAALEFWLEIYRGQAEAFGRGPEAIPDMLTPGQMQQTAEAEAPA